jgi:hypothetical protein
MKKVFLCNLFILLAMPGSVLAQDQEAFQKIESARIALITERLGLSPDQAEKFWPIYREYNEQRQLLRQERQEIRRGVDPKKLSEEESKRIMERGHALRQRELNLDQDYSERMLRVISNQQILALKNAEEDFRRMLVERIERQRAQQMQREQMRERREEMMRQRRGN